MNNNEKETFNYILTTENIDEEKENYVKGFHTYISLTNTLKSLLLKEEYCHFNIEAIY